MVQPPLNASPPANAVRALHISLGALLPRALLHRFRSRDKAAFRELFGKNDLSGISDGNAARNLTYVAPLTMP
jgi:hypothetical protein